MEGQKIGGERVKRRERVKRGVGGDGEGEDEEEEEGEEEDGRRWKRREEEGE